MQVTNKCFYEHINIIYPCYALPIDHFNTTPLRIVKPQCFTLVSWCYIEIACSWRPLDECRGILRSIHSWKKQWRPIMAQCIMLHHTGKIDWFLSHSNVESNLVTNCSPVKIFVSAQNLETNPNFEYGFDSNIYFWHVLFICVTLQI